MEREDLTKRLDWLKEPESFKPEFSGKRVELTQPFELTPIQGDDDSAPGEGKGPIIEVPATEETAKQQSVPGEPILEAIRSRTILKTVSMEGNSYSKPFCQALAHILKTKTTIERALFNDMFVGRKIPDIHPSLKYFAEAFLRFDNLTVLDFRYSHTQYYSEETQTETERRHRARGGLKVEKAQQMEKKAEWHRK